MTVDPRIEQAELLYHRATFGGDSAAIAAAHEHLDAVEAELAMSRGRVIHARFLADRAAPDTTPEQDPRELDCFRRAAELYARLGDERGEGEALFWIGTFHQVVRDDTATAMPAFERSLELATRTGDRLTMSYALRHIGFADHMAGRLDHARARFEESTRLRRDLGFRPGVAANLVGLAYVAAQQDRRDEAAAHLTEAAALAAATSSAAVQEWITTARTDLALP